MHIAKDIGLTFNSKMCQICLPTLFFNIATFYKDSMKVDPEKVQGIQDLPTSENINWLQSFQGLITYM